MSDPLVSIIIPTKDRQKYAEMTVRQILKLNKKVDIVVQDNSNTPSLASALSDVIDSGLIKYNYDASPLSFSENYNRAAENASGEYLCAIGDDDGVLPTIFDCAKWMKNNEIDVVKPAKDLVYIYAGNKRRSKCLGLGVYSGLYNYVNTEAEVISLLNNGGTNYLETLLTGSYHGLISMKVMKKIKETTGVYYGSLTPDMYSVACVNLVPGITAVSLDYPITLPGICPISGSAAGRTGTHAGKIEEAPHLKNIKNYVWSEEVPKFYSVETIWAETLLDSIRAMNRDDLIDKYFNEYALILHIFENNKKYFRQINECLSGEKKKYLNQVYLLAGKKIDVRLYNKMSNGLQRLFRKRRMYNKVESIEKAIDKTLYVLKKDNVILPWQY